MSPAGLRPCATEQCDWRLGKPPQRAADPMNKPDRSTTKGLMEAWNAAHPDKQGSANNASAASSEPTRTKSVMGGSTTVELMAAWRAAAPSAVAPNQKPKQSIRQKVERLRELGDHQSADEADRALDEIERQQGRAIGDDRTE